MNEFGLLNLTNIILELVTDLTNNLLFCKDWLKNELFSLHVDLILPPKILDANILFSKAAVVPVEKYGKADDFIDNIISIRCFSKRWKRLAGALLLSLHDLEQPALVNKPLSCNNLIAMKKLQVEEQFSKQQIVLGWDIDT